MAVISSKPRSQSIRAPAWLTTPCLFCIAACGGSDPVDHSITVNAADGGGLPLDATIDSAIDGSLSDADASAPPIEGTAVSVAAGLSHTCAALSSGRVACWGSNDHGESGRDSASGTNLASPVAVDGIDDAVEVAAGGRSSCSRSSAGTIACWGLNAEGQLGLGDRLDRFAPAAVTGVSGATRIACGTAHCCAVAAGAVVCWGANEDGQLGDGTVVGRSTAQRVLGIMDAIDVACGANHTCAALDSGVVTCWGGNEGGQLGDGSQVSRSTPAAVGTVSDAESVSAGDGFSCSATGSGQAYCWGSNMYGELGAGVPAARVLTPVAVATLADVRLVSGNSLYQACALRETGAVACWGWNAFGELGDGTSASARAPTAVTGITDATAITVGQNHTCAIAEGGGLWCWGSNRRGQLGIGARAGGPEPMNAPGLESATALALGAHHTCGRMQDGTVACWGRNQLRQLADGTRIDRVAKAAIAGLAGVASIGAAGGHTCTIGDDGSLRCWGATLGASPTLVGGINGALAVSLSSGHRCARTSTTVWCWGRNGDGQLGDGTHDTRASPVAVAGLGDAQEIDLGGEHSCARSSAGAVFCWGAARTLGNGTEGQSSSPVRVSGVSDAAQIAVGSRHACVRRSNKTVSCWGENDFGQLGDGSTTNRLSPVPVSGLSDVDEIAAGDGDATCARTSTGTVWCWGSNALGQLADELPHDRCSSPWGETPCSRVPLEIPLAGTATAIAVGTIDACARLSNGSTECWGSNSHGQLGDGTSGTATTPAEVTW